MSVASLKYLNNVIEQDHRAIRRRWRAAQCFRSSHAAERTLEGIEAMHMMRKGQVNLLNQNRRLDLHSIDELRVASTSDSLDLHSTPRFC